MFSVYADDKLLYSPRLLDEGYAITEPQATLELNKAGSFTFNLPDVNPLYSGLKKLKTLITIRDDGEVIWKGRVLNDTKNFYNTKAVTCEGELAFLNDIQYPPHDYSKKGIKMGEYFKLLIKHYNATCSSERQIDLGTVSGSFTDVLIYPKTTDYTNVWNLISGNLIGASTGKVGKNEVDLSDYDRYLYVRRTNGVAYLDYVEKIGKKSGQTIEFGKNMLDLSEYVNAANVYTQIIPLGKADSKGNRVDIKTVNGGKNYLQSETGIALFGIIQKSVIWDDVTNRNTLKTNGQRMLDKAIELAIKITIRAFDLHLVDVNTDKIEFGDTVRVVSVPHGISSDFLCTKIAFDLGNPENTEYTFGLEFESMTENYASYKRTYQYKMESALDMGDQNAQELVDAIARLNTLQTQVDGNICSWFYPGKPTASNAPASEWTTDDLKQQHLGDLYYDKDTGIGYRWTASENSYKWEVIKDAEVKQALDAASEAKEAADGKVRCFIAQPRPPYDIGDLWVGDSTSDILRCKTARASGSFNANDWQKASKYTDDSNLNSFKDEYHEEISQVVKKDNVISEINQSAEEVTIQAKRINLKGAVTAEDIAADAISAKHIQADTITIANMAFGSTAMKIWENAAPNAAFSMQELTFDQIFSFLLIVYKGASDTGNGHTNRAFVRATQVIPCDLEKAASEGYVGNSMHIMSIPYPVSCYDYDTSTWNQYYKVTSGAPLMALRAAQASYGTRTYIFFYEGAYGDSYNSVTTTGNGTRNGRNRNQYAIPIEIYGIK